MVGYHKNLFYIKATLHNPVLQHSGYAESKKETNYTVHLVREDGATP